ncbi:MFS transporter [Sphaerisporangium album]|uniref:MFS transporter n=1 Tax=Sphaerisporangium album TaxID=509200 RepID=A0A367F753_9ACTN|nr:MFS transporter [Sphaerisporangium album]RCG26198.1 MFS transporter [Sphaerisporangium album]
MLELLKDGTYIRYWLAVVASFLGDATARVTLIYVAATLTDAPALLIALVILAQMLPAGVLAAFIGPLADHVPARVLLVGSDLARVVIVLAMIPARGSAWLLLLLILLEGVGKAFFETARISAIPKIVGGHGIPAAVALFQSTNHTINLVGPALGGLLIALGSVPVVLGVNAATFVVSAVLLGSMGVLREVPVAGGAGREPYWQALRTGVRGVMAVPSLRFLGAFLVPVMIVLGLFTTNLNAQLLTVFDLSALQFGVAQAMFGAGSILGALIGPGLVRRYSSNRLLIGAVMLFGLSLLLLGPTGWLADRLGMVVISLWCVLAGLGSGLFQVPVANTVLRDLPEELRGRGVGLLNALMVNFTVVGVIVGGVVAQLVSVAGSIIVSGLLLVIAAAAFAVVPMRRLRQSEASG